MANIVKFPGKKPFRKIDTGELLNRFPKPSGGFIVSCFRFCLNIIRLPIFLVMYWLRGPILFVANMLSGLMLFGFLFNWYAFPEHANMTWGMATVSLISFIVAWVYDLILMALSPQEMFRGL